MDRRKFLKDALYGGTATWLVTKSAAAQNIGIAGLLPDTPFFGDSSLAHAQRFAIAANANTAAVFTCSAASGDPAPNGIVLWTRISPEAVISAGNAVVWEIASTPGFGASVVLRGGAQFSAITDNTVKIPVVHPALRPFTTYYYRFIYNGTPTRTCRFKTLPAAGSFVGRVRIAYISCQDYTSGYYTALSHLANENIDYVVHLGDYIYESIGESPFEGAQVRPIPNLPSGGQAAASLADYRFLYQIYRSDPNLQFVHERFAFIQVWDDHEFQNDAWRDRFPDNGDPMIPHPDLRKQANQAWAEYTPSNIEYNPSGGPLDSIRLYRSFAFGDLAELIITDERLYRDGPPCGFDIWQRYVLAKSCAEREQPLRTMLGITQKEWFIEKVKTSRSAWKIWANELMLMQLKLLNAGQQSIYLSFDTWDGYPAERADILRRLQGVQNLIAISGDNHSFASGYLKADYDTSSSPVTGIEFVGGSVTSSNLEEIFNSLFPSPSDPVPRSLPRVPPAAIASAARSSNRGMQFFNSTTHGYTVLDITPWALQCSMWQVSTIREPAATLSLLRSFVVLRNLTFLFEQ